MPRNSRRRGPDYRVIHRILSDENVPLDEKHAYLQVMRQQSAENNPDVDRFLLRENDQLRARLRENEAVHAQIEEIYKELEEKFKRLTAPPLYPGTFLEYTTIGDEQTALVSCKNGLTFVTLDEQFDGGDVKAGDQVLLSGDLNLLVGKVSCTPLNSGETAIFSRYTPDNRLIVTRRDEEIVINASESLRGVVLEKGDEVRWSPVTWMAYEKIERSTGEHYFIKDVPRVAFSDIGGLDQQIEDLKNLVLLHLKHPELASGYGLAQERAVLLDGPPGTGKTMLVKAFVNWLQSLSPCGKVRFINIKPGELGSMWYSKTEEKIQDVFAAAREAAEADPETPVVMFFDEFDWIASARGQHIHRVDDRAVDALGVELDGLEDRGNVIVIAATNRKDILDEALIRPGRFGDEPIRVGRPNRASARSILSKYLCDERPYATGSGSPECVRDGIIESALSRLYSPNGEGDVATITFRDGTRRTIRVHELLSGAVLAKIARRAGRRACLREIETGERGIQPTDVFEAIAEEIENAASLLTPANCSRYVRDLPQDVDVVGVEPVKRKTAEVHRFLRVA